MSESLFQQGGEEVMLYVGIINNKLVGIWKVNDGIKRNSFADIDFLKM